LEEGRWVLHLTQCGKGRRRKLGAVPLSVGGAGSPSNTLWPRPKPTSLPSGILIHPVAWPQQTWAKNWGCPFGERELGLHLTHCGLGRGLSPCQVASCSIQLFRHKRHGPKIGVCPFGGGGAGSPSNTMWPGPSPTSLPSGILIHPAVWPYQAWVENWGTVPLWGRGSWVPISRSVAGAEAYLRAKLHLDLPNRLATIHQRHTQDRTDRYDNGPIG